MQLNTMNEVRIIYSSFSVLKWFVTNFCRLTSRYFSHADQRDKLKVTVNMFPDCKRNELLSQ